MAAEVTLSYEPNSSGYGSIRARVSASGFAGATGFAATVDEVQPFLSALAEYPLQSPAKLAIGEFDDGTLIEVVVSPANSRGGLRVDVQLRSDGNRARLVSTSLSTVYPDLEGFRVALTAAIRSGGEATLRGEDTLR